MPKKIIVKDMFFGDKSHIYTKKCNHLTKEHMSTFKETNQLRFAIFTMLTSFQAPKSAPIHIFYNLKF